MEIEPGLKQFPTPEEEWQELNLRRKIIIEEISHGGQTPEDRSKTDIALKSINERMTKLQEEYGKGD